MHDSPSPDIGLTRRGFMSFSGQSLLALGATAVVAQLIPVTLLAADALPALPQGLLRMGRDIYPHDRLEDRHYAKPLAELVSKQPKLIADGLRQLQTSAEQRHGQAFEALGTEIDRVALLREIETGPFFSAVRNALMFGIYDSPALFPLFGYEGSSWEKGGYLTRGFNDLDWL